MTSPRFLGAVVVLTGLLAGAMATRAAGQERGVTRLDATGAFFYPAFAARPDQQIAAVTGGEIDTATYLRYLAAKLGSRHVEDLTFDVLLARECLAGGLAKSAPTLARAMATQRLLKSGRSAGADPDGDLRRKFATEALRQLRIDALVRAARLADDAALQARFEHRYGVGGERVRVRQVLVSFGRMQERLEEAGAKSNVAAVRAAARRRAAELHARVGRGDSLVDLLVESDERSTRRLLRDPDRVGQAGFLLGYNYLRYGSSFAAAVRDLEVGQVSGPVESSTGFHLIELVDRVVTRLEDVLESVRREVAAGPAKPGEAQALRVRLLRQYRFRARE